MIHAQTFRQVIIGIGLTLCSISDGFIFGQMSGMIEALRPGKSSISFTNDDLSWMASTINILCVLGFAVTGSIADSLGRRKAIALVCAPVTACWVVIYMAQNKILLLIMRGLLGICFGGVIFLVYCCIGEYYPPHIRALLLNLITNVGSLVGLASGHILSILLNWRYVALIGALPSGLSLMSPFFWVESPEWLAAKGRYEESEKAFKLLHFPDEKSDKELRLILAYEKKKRGEVSRKAHRVFIGKEIRMAVKQKYFWKIFSFATVICTYRIASGRILFSTLAITMLQDITGTSNILLFTLAVDGFAILGSVLSCFFLYKFKIRGLLFTSGIIANVFLVVLGICVYMLPDIDVYMSWAKVSLLSVYFVIIMAGPQPILDTTLSEIFPIEIKSFFVVLIGIITGIAQFLSIKLVPDMLPVMGYHGIFFVNASVVFLCLVYLWLYLPETKGRSLHEIEYFFKNNTFNYSKDLFTKAQTDDLLINKL